MKEKHISKTLVKKKKKKKNGSQKKKKERKGKLEEATRPSSI